MIDQEVKKIIIDNLLIETSLCSWDLKTKRKLQHFSFIKTKNEKIRKKFELILDHAFAAEKECPGAGHFFLRYLVNQEEINYVIPRNRLDLIDLLKSKSLSKNVVEILKTCLEMSSKNTKITIKKSSNNSTCLELFDGYTFEVQSLLKIKNLELKNTKIICIDGYIESVSEIHHLLERLSETKEQAVLFCRGMSNDVLNTIKVNLDRQTITLYPYIVNFDVFDANKLVDIAVVSNNDIVTSLKGNLISSIDLEKIKSVDSCSCSQSIVRIKNQKSSKRIEEHILHLKKLLEERPEIEEILAKRLKSLTSNCLDISIPDDMNFYSNCQQLDEGIRIISSVINKIYQPNKTVRKYVEAYSNYTNFIYFTQ